MKTLETGLKSLFLVPAILWILLSTAPGASVKVSEQDIDIPTYLAGEPEPNPMFYFGRGSQGAEGRVYPYPLYDSLTNIKSNKTYRIVYLENEYVRIGILPEIGGRLFEAVDKSNGYNFIYRQHVIKPALIGLIGAWISGGVEWNIPHHHRATTFLPVQYKIEHSPDGSQTIWVGELELRDRMRWAVGYTLHPGKSYLECAVRILNRTPFANTMLCFANVAVHVNENYQVIYPPGTRFVTFHSKHEFANWPIATTRYAGADFTRGVDVSWYLNHISANSMFAWNYEDDFFAGYDHGKNAGIMSFADHHAVPGKKFWTWGNGPRGRMWDKILTDTDGPYIELMVGAYSDNQPDYSWLQPGETKSIRMYWYPFRDIDGVKKANLDAAVNLEIRTNKSATLGFCTTAAYPSATVRLQGGDKVLLEEKIAIDPARPYAKQFAIPADLSEYDLRASLSVEGKELIAYSPSRLEPVAMPDPVKPPASPQEMKTSEELYLAGQRIEQFHAPGLIPESYWVEGLRRDPGDARINTSFGIRKLKEARFAEAAAHFRKAIERLSASYTSPKDSEPYYYLGVALQSLAFEHAFHSASNRASSDLSRQELKESFDAFYKATWGQAWRAPAYYGLAEIATQRGELSPALDYVEHSLEANSLNLRAINLRAALLRHLGRVKEVRAFLEVAAQNTDPLDVRLQTERWLAGDKQAASELMGDLRDHPATGLETAAEYADAGLWQDGIAVLELMISSTKDKARVSPLAFYYLAYFADRLGQTENAAAYRESAARMSPEYVFPFQWEMIPVLRSAMESRPRDARAPYYLGNLLYDWQPEEALKLWEKSAELDPAFPIVHRNLALAYSHQKPTNDVARAITELQLAIRPASSDSSASVGTPQQAVSGMAQYALHLGELDELYAAAGESPDKRLALLERNHRVVLKRDDVLSREIGLKVFAGKDDEAIQLMTGRKFSVWEGGALEVADHWVNAHLLRGRQALRARQFAAALADFQAAKSIPENLPNDRGGDSRAAEIAYWIGCAFDGLGDATKAKQSWQEAVEFSPASSRRRSEGRGLDRQMQSYYSALAMRKLGRTAEADGSLHNLIEAATNSLSESTNASSAASDRKNHDSRQAMAHCLAGLAHLGLGQTQESRSEFELALKASPDFLTAKAELAELQ